VGSKEGRKQRQSSQVGNKKLRNEFNSSELTENMKLPTLLGMGKSLKSNGGGGEGGNAWPDGHAAYYLKEYSLKKKTGIKTYRVLMEPRCALLRLTNVPRAERF
jgi:hypothetical protein